MAGDPEGLVDRQADLSTFTLGSMLRLLPGLRELSDGCSSVEQFAQRTSEFLFDSFRDRDGSRQTALVRVYGTAAFGDLPDVERLFAARAAPGLDPGTTCLLLLGTAGTDPDWNDRTASVGHRVIPLRDAAQVGRLPMIAALLTQLGIDIDALVSARADIVLPAQDDHFRVFFVPEAAGSQLIPAQRFVNEHGIASALGFGGALPGGEMYAVVIFSTIPVPLTAASLFGTVALSTSLAVVDMMELPLLQDQVVPAGGGSRRRRVSRQDCDRSRHELTRALLRVHEQVALEEADRAVAALEQADYDAGRAASIAAVALRLGSVRSVADVTELVLRDGLPILGASGVSLALDQGDGTARLHVSSSFSDDVRQKYGSLPLDDSVPSTLTARTGAAVFVTDRVDGTSRYPALADMYADTGLEALASLPLIVDEHLLGSLTLVWATATEFTPAAVELMGALAAQAAQAVDRVRLLDAERGRSATLQRSFLTRPDRSDDVEIEVRYLPAAANAQIGGDWYDAFVGPDGMTVIAVGDVVGHDMLAAAVMAQVRNLLRGIVFSRPGSPAGTLQHLERAMAGLELESLATLFLARLEPATNGSAGRRRLEWCNAGHPPPLLIEGSTGVVEVLDPEPDLMIGVHVDANRTVHHRMLSPGSLLLLYTDGLVERRGEDLHDGISRLAAALAATSKAPLSSIADHVLSLADGTLEDDAAVLALRVGHVSAGCGCQGRAPAPPV